LGLGSSPDKLHEPPKIHLQIKAPNGAEMETWLLATKRETMKHDQAMVTIAARIPAAHAEILRQQCGQNFQMMSDGIRLAVELYVQKIQKGENNDQ
jgi:hypothetical protein